MATSGAQISQLCRRCARQFPAYCPRAVLGRKAQQVCPWKVLGTQCPPEIWSFATLRLKNGIEAWLIFELIIGTVALLGLVLKAPPLLLRWGLLVTTRTFVPQNYWMNSWFIWFISHVYNFIFRYSEFLHEFIGMSSSIYEFFISYLNSWIRFHNMNSWYEFVTENQG